MGNKEIIEGLYSAFAAGDIPTVLKGFAPDIEWNEAEGFMYGGRYIGPDAILQNIFMKFGTEWEGFSVVADRIIDGGDTVVGLGTYSGKYLPTGRSMSVPFAHIWTMKDGRVAKFDQYTDTLVIAKSLEL